MTIITDRIVNYLKMMPEEDKNAIMALINRRVEAMKASFRERAD